MHNGIIIPEKWERFLQLVVEGVCLSDLNNFNSYLPTKVFGSVRPSVCVSVCVRSHGGVSVISQRWSIAFFLYHCSTNLQL